MRRADLLVDICSQTTYPGYGYFISKGFDTWPEAWNAVTSGSQMHGCYNGIGSWFHAALGGIQPIPNAPGMQHILVRPAVGVRNILSASAETNTGFGKVAVHWEVDAKSRAVVLLVTLPPNTKGLLQIDAAQGAVQEGGLDVAEAEGIQVVSERNHTGSNAREFALQAGTYRLTYQLDT